MKTQATELALKSGREALCRLRPTVLASIPWKAEPEAKIEVLTLYRGEMYKPRTVRVRKNQKEGKGRCEALDEVHYCEISQQAVKTHSGARLTC